MIAGSFVWIVWHMLGDGSRELGLSRYYEVMGILSEPSKGGYVHARTKLGWVHSLHPEELETSAQAGALALHLSAPWGKARATWSHNQPRTTAVRVST